MIKKTFGNAVLAILFAVVAASSSKPMRAQGAMLSGATLDAAATRLVVTVTAQASDPNGFPLQYRWASSDGHIVNSNAPSTTWTLANGPGLHFAYVLVSNGAGGYTERRIAVNTDKIGTPILSHPPVTYAAPPASVPAGEVYRSFVQGAAASAAGDAFNIQDIYVFAQDVNNTVRFPPSGSVKASVRGEFAIPGVLPTSSTDEVDIFCDLNAKGSFGTSCGAISPDNGAAFDLTANQAVTDYIFRKYYSGDPPNDQLTAGSARLADGTVCGTVNEFFGVTVTGTASLVDASNNVIAGPARMSNLGAYILLANPAATQVLLKCEGAAPQYVPIGSAGDLGTTTFPGTAQPSVTAMTVTLNGSNIGIFLPPPTGPSDVVPNPERFLSYKGIDSLQDACAYYQTIGAAQGCDSQGQLISPILFDDWMRTTQMGKYAPPGAPPEFTATYINKADLNLARSHHSISYSSNHTAAYVCNHLGPSVLDPAQSEIDSVVNKTINNQNLVACVAMDYMATPGVNGGKPFVRFLIFGPNNRLLPSINLDGRREKYVPGTCIVCHGGDHYAGHFLARNSADVGAHFLPYDTGNFEFSSKPGLTEADQEEAIYNLNQNVLKVKPTVAAAELIAGWYATSHALDKNYLPASWAGKGAAATNFYLHVVARSCRSCHVAMVEGYNFDHFKRLQGQSGYRENGKGDLAYTIGCNGGDALLRSHSMPNSLVTFNRFWNSVGTPVDQQAISNAFFGSNDAVDLNCVP